MTSRQRHVVKQLHNIYYKPKVYKTSKPNTQSNLKKKILRYNCENFRNQTQTQHIQTPRPNNLPIVSSRENKYSCTFIKNLRSEAKQYCRTIIHHHIISSTSLISLFEFILQSSAFERMPLVLQSCSIACLTYTSQDSSKFYSLKSCILFPMALFIYAHPSYSKSYQLDHKDRQMSSSSSKIQLTQHPSYKSLGSKI